MLAKQRVFGHINHSGCCLEGVGDMPEFMQLEREERKPRGAVSSWDHSWKALGEKRLSGWVVEGQGTDARLSFAGESHQKQSAVQRRPATLQDYFRWNGRKLQTDEELTAVDLLDEVRGEIFHIIHTPLESRSGSELWKANADDERWTLIDNAVNALVERAKAEALRPLQDRTFPASIFLQGATLANLTIVGELDIDGLGSREEWYAHLNEKRDSEEDGPSGLARRAGQATKETEHAPVELEPYSPPEIDSPRLEVIDLSKVQILGRAQLSGVHAINLMVLSSTLIDDFVIIGCAFDGDILIDDTISQDWFRLLGSLVSKKFDVKSSEIYALDFEGSSLGGRVWLRDLTAEWIYFDKSDFAGATIISGESKFKTAFPRSSVFRESFYIEAAEGHSLIAEHLIALKNFALTRTNFSGNLRIRSCELQGGVNLQSSRVTGYTNFQGSLFFGGGQFESAHFDKDAWFTGSAFWGQVSFDHARFDAEAYFHEVRFRPKPGDKPADRTITFYQTRFGGAAGFEGAHFFESVSFERARFNGFADFGRQPPSWHNDGNGIKGACFEKRMSFRSAEFLRNADFAACSFPAKVGDRSSAFAGAHFRAALDFQGVDTLPFSAFNGARLENGVLLDTKHPNEKQFQAALKETQKAVDEDKRLGRDYRRENKKDPDEGRRGQDNRFSALEGGCRVLKLAHGDDGDYQREQQFFRYELLARRRRPTKGLLLNRDRTVSGLEKFLSHLYGMTSNYGAAMFKPLGWVIMSALLSAVLYWLIGYGVGVQGQAETSQPALTLAANINTGLGSAETWLQARAEPAGLHWQQVFPLEFDEAEHAQFRQQFSHGGDALDLAFHNVFRPFGVWWPNFAGETQPWLHNLKEGLGNWGWVGLRVFASLQSIFSIAMLFLSGLALRRKFQISGS